MCGIDAEEKLITLVRSSLPPRKQVVWYGPVPRTARYHRYSRGQAPAPSPPPTRLEEGSSRLAIFSVLDTMKNFTTPQQRVSSERGDSARPMTFGPRLQVSRSFSEFFSKQRYHLFLATIISATRIHASQSNFALLIHHPTDSFPSSFGRRGSNYSGCCRPRSATDWLLGPPTTGLVVWTEPLPRRGGPGAAWFDLAGSPCP